MYAEYYTSNTHLYRVFLSTMHPAHLWATFHRNVLKQHPEGVNGAVVTDDNHAHPSRAVGERLEEVLVVDAGTRSVHCAVARKNFFSLRLVALEKSYLDTDENIGHGLSAQRAPK